MKKNIIFIISILITTTNLVSQSTNQDIVWEAETNFEYILEQNESLNFDILNPNNGLLHSMSNIETIKIDIRKSDVFPNKFFTETLINLLKKGDIKSYSLDKKNELSKEDIEVLTTLSDTVIIYEPETYKEEIQIVRNDYSNKINSFIINQKWEYSNRTNKLTCEVLGIIPILHFKSGKRKLFWIPFSSQKSNKKLDINKQNKIWIKISADRVSFDDLTEKKGNTNDFFADEIWSKSIRNEHKTYDVENSIFFAKELATNYIEDKILETQVDTVITFDPETYKETLDVRVREGITFEMISGYKLYQFWYFDQVQMTFNSELVGIAPLISIENKEDKMEYYLPLFNIKFD